MSTYEIWPPKLLSNKGFISNIADPNLPVCWVNLN